MLSINNRPLWNNRSFWFARYVPEQTPNNRMSSLIGHADEYKEKNEYRIPTWDEEELSECRERIVKLEKRLKDCPIWFTAERRDLKHKIHDEEKQIEKIMSRMAGSGQIEIR